MFYFILNLAFVQPSVEPEPSEQHKRPLSEELDDEQAPRKRTTIHDVGESIPTSCSNEVVLSTSHQT